MAKTTTLDFNKSTSQSHISRVQTSLVVEPTIQKIGARDDKEDGPVHDIYDPIITTMSTIQTTDGAGPPPEDARRKASSMMDRYD